MIDRTYEIVEAVGYVETGQKAGNVVIRFGDALRADPAAERSQGGARAS